LSVVVAVAVAAAAAAAAVAVATTTDDAAAAGIVVCYRNYILKSRRICFVLCFVLCTCLCPGGDEVNVVRGKVGARGRGSDGGRRETPGRGEEERKY
jgi:hypothetical protein